MTHYVAIFMAATAWLPHFVDASENPGAREGWIKVERNAHWCGAKALWLISHGYGTGHSLNEIKQLCDPDGDSDGLLTLNELHVAAQGIGLQAMPVQCNLEWLKQCRLPALTVHRTNNAEQADKDFAHCYVFLSHRDGNIRVIDPYWPTDVLEWSDDRFSRTWTGHALLLSQDVETLPKAKILQKSVIAVLCADIMLITLFGLWLTRRRSRATVVAIALPSLLFSSGCGNEDSLHFPQPDYTFPESSFLSAERPPLLTHNFQFENRSTDSVRILQAIPACSSCTDVAYPDEPIAPRDVGEIQIKFSPAGYEGVVKHSVRIETDSANAPVIMLSFTARIIPAPRVHPPLLEFGRVPVSETATGTVELRVPLAGELPPEVSGAVSSTDCECQVVLARIEDAQEGMKTAVYVVEAECRPKVSGRKIGGTLTLHFSDRDNVLAIPVSGRVIHSEFDVTPAIVCFGRLSADSASQRVVIQSKLQTAETRQEFYVESDGAGISLSAPKPVDGKPGEFYFDVHLASGSSHVFSGSIFVRSSRDEDALLHEVRYFGQR